MILLLVQSENKVHKINTMVIFALEMLILVLGDHIRFATSGLHLLHIFKSQDVETFCQDLGGYLAKGQATVVDLHNITALQRKKRN